MRTPNTLQLLLLHVQQLPQSLFLPLPLPLQHLLPQHVLLQLRLLQLFLLQFLLLVQWLLLQLTLP